MNDEGPKHADDLYISLKFPPMTDVSGIVLAKIALLNGKPIDVVHNYIEEPVDDDFNEIIEKLINHRIIIKNFELTTNKKALNKSFNKYIKEGMEKLEETNPNYKTITTRSWGIQPNFLALEYKLKHPETEWIAEFSDPIIFDINNKRRNVNISPDEEEYVKKINAEIDKINEKISEDGEDFQFEKLNKEDDIYLLCEYLAYIFADKVRFTNENQREVMLSQFPYDVKDFVMKKSEIFPHPTLDEEYYHIKEIDYEVEEDCINIGYFGTYFGKRNFEPIFYAIESLDDEIKNKIKLHLFIMYGDNLKSLTNNLSVSENIKVNEKVSLLEFLNLCTKFDILLVNDTETKETFKINPYRPSKIADYIGSKKDIWGICEKGSVMSSLEEIKYKSYINDFHSAKLVMNQIVNDFSSKLNLSQNLTSNEKSQNKEKLDDYFLKHYNKKFDEVTEEEILEIIDENNFLIGRVNLLNHLFNGVTGRSLFPHEAERLQRKNKKLEGKTKKLEGENKKLKINNKKLKKDLKYLKTNKGSIKYHLKKIIK